MADTSLSFSNVWVASVDGGARRTPGWAAVIVATAAVALGLFGGAALYRATAPEPHDYLALVGDRLWQDACVLGPLVLAAWAMLALVERRAPPVALGAAPRAAAAGVAGFLLALGLAALAGAVWPGASASPLGHRLAGVAVGAALVLVQAGAEEVFFRGWLQPVLAARWGPLVGLAAASLLFAGAHALIQPVGPTAFVNDALAGAGFGLFALRSGGLAAPIAAHWGWNWTEQALVGCTPNPGVDPLGSLFDLDLRGPSWISGGLDEMNGSVCATVALVALVAAACLMRGRRRSTAP